MKEKFLELFNAGHIPFTTLKLMKLIYKRRMGMSFTRIVGMGPIYMIGIEFTIGIKHSWNA